MNAVRTFTEHLYARFCRQSMTLSLLLGILFSSSFGCALALSRQITNTPLQNESSRLINKVLIPSSIAFAISLLLIFVMGRLLSRHDGFTNAAKAYGFSFLFSGLNAAFLIAAGVSNHHMKAVHVFVLALLLFAAIYLAILMYTQYLTYHALRRAFQIGRIKSAIFLFVILVPGFLANLGWAMPNRSERFQSVDKNFLQSFRNALADDFSEFNLSTMMGDHSQLLTPNYLITQVMHGNAPTFPLARFTEDPLYLKNIHKLLESTNRSHRELAYLVIGASGDTSKADILLERLNTESDTSALTWVAMSLMNLNTPHTTAIFDFLVKYETLGDAHLLPAAVKLNPDSLQQTAYLKIHSADPKSRIIAASFLAATKPNARTEFLLKQAIRDWDINIKGYAIRVLAEHQYGNVLETVRPLLEITQTRGISLQALANSPTPDDQSYLALMIGTQDTIPATLLKALFMSKNIDNVILSLKLLHTKPIESQFYLPVSKQPLITSDSVLPEVQAAIKQVKNVDIRERLIPVLVNRTDDKSIDLMISLLREEDISLRRRVARSLKNNPSPRLKDDQVQALIKEALVRND